MTCTDVVSRDPQIPVHEGFITRLRAALALRRSRHQLAALDAHLLRDIGLTRDAALRPHIQRVLLQSLELRSSWVHPRHTQSDAET